MLRDWLAVAIGGMLGSTARYGLMLAFAAADPKYLPLATLSANVVGCFAMGIISQLAIHHWDSQAWWVVGIRVGLLGGLTTFSSFAVDVVRSWEAGRTGEWLLLVAAHCGLGILAMLGGMLLVANCWPTSPSAG